jgi:hypothetical protein
MRITKWTTISLIALAFSCMGASRLSAGDSHGTKVKWDIFQYEDVTASTFTIAPGGISTSQATFYPAQLAGDNSTITVTGSGTFRLNEGHDVTGGGTWTTAAADGSVTGTGTYRVTEVVFFEFGAGTLAGAPGITDETGTLDDTRAGLAVLRVHYSDGTKGILVLVCNIAGPQAVIEGTTATKGVVDYSNPLIPTVEAGGRPGFGETGNTLFHTIPED